MAAARKLSNAAVAVAVAVAAMLVMATAAQNCSGDLGRVMSSCRSYCDGSHGMLNQCCDALKHANTRCLCDSYWGALQRTRYASCAKNIESQCGLAC